MPLPPPPITDHDGRRDIAAGSATAATDTATAGCTALFLARLAGAGAEARRGFTCTRNRCGLAVQRHELGLSKPANQPGCRQPGAAGERG